MLLSSLRVGECALIDSVKTEDSMRRRLYELGFIKGAETVCLMRSPHGKSAAYSICGSVIALRDRDAMTIAVKESES